MPITRISLMRGKSPEYLAMLCDTFHRAMVETFDVPSADRFHVIHQCSPGELVFDRDYLAGPRSDDYLFFDVTIGKPRTAEVKQAFYRRVTELLGDTLGVRAADVMIVITTTGREDWSFGNGRAQMTEAA
ncbi:tautomerase family protein [Rhizobium tumorigenes]|uniref:Tautomerase family protein n=1 Tax=Rhizobium tumorigenes TaxID=2041385 RepID=A0AAF1K8S1_9HYPH|nr:tautomerase family protein [Rhizobium tumorigenes]WFR94532.1 tautomerase family protein [Rhizobium tumorigenes]